MWQRLLRFLAKTMNSLRPDAFVMMQTVERWATADKLAGRVLLIMGDFNRLAASLDEWSKINGLSSWSVPLAKSKLGSTFATFNGTSTVKPSHIDHIFLQQDAQFEINSAGGGASDFGDLVSP